jgi:hypothetical protein
MNRQTPAWIILVLCSMGISSFAQTPLVNHGDNWHYRKGTNAPQSNWKTAADASLDATWLIIRRKR